VRQVVHLPEDVISRINPYPANVEIMVSS